MIARIRYRSLATRITWPATTRFCRACIQLLLQSIPCPFNSSTQNSAAHVEIHARTLPHSTRRASATLSDSAQVDSVTCSFVPTHPWQLVYPADNRLSHALSERIWHLIFVSEHAAPPHGIRTLVLALRTAGGAMNGCTARRMVDEREICLSRLLSGGVMQLNDARDMLDGRRVDSAHC